MPVALAWHISTSWRRQCYFRSRCHATVLNYGPWLNGLLLQYSGVFFLKTRLLYLASCIGTILLAYKYLSECFQHAFSHIMPCIQAHFMRLSRTWAKVAKPNVSVEAKHDYPDLFWNRCGEIAFSTYFWTPDCNIPNQHSQWWKIPGVVVQHLENRNRLQLKAHLNQFSSNSDFVVVYGKIAQAEPYLNYSHMS